jgi:DNA gyrase subunit A
MGRTAAGVRGVNLREGDVVVDMALVDPMATLLTVCENGYGKRTEFEEYRLQSRGGTGSINTKTSERNGLVVGMKSVRDADELMLITRLGMIVRTGVSQMRAIGRATQGVRVINLRDEDQVVCVARVESEDSDQRELPLEGDASPNEAEGVETPPEPEGGSE